VRGVEWTTIGVGEDGVGSQQGGAVSGSSNDVLIYAGCMLEGCVKETGGDNSRSNSLDIQAPGISRRLLPSLEAMFRVARLGPEGAKGMGWWWGRVKPGLVEGENSNHEKQIFVHYDQRFVLCAFV